MPTLKMEDLVGDFEDLKISALSKSKQINAYVKNTTIGPNRSIIEDEEATTYEDVDFKLPKYTHTHRYDATNTTMINKLRAEMENQRQVKVQEAMNHHKNRILKFSKEQSLNSNQQMQRQKQVLLNEKQQQELMIIQALEQHDKDASVKQQQLIQYYGELAERRKKIDRELQERERRRQLITAIIERIKKDQIEFRCVYQEIINTFKNYKYQNQLKAVLGDIPKQMKALPDSMDDIVNKCKAGKVSENECQRSSQLVQDIKGVLEAVQQKIAAITAEQELAKPEPKPQPPAPQQQLPPQPSQTSVISVSQAESIPKQASVAPTQLNKFVSISSLRTYSELQDYLDNHNKTFEELLQNDAYKQFRFNCKKAVNIPVNAISAVNAHHLLDKYNRLSSLLSGKTVEVGGTQICAAKHQQGLPFCMNLLAKKFVLQGDLMISSNPEAAFCYATIIVALWNEHPNFGKLLLAHFHRQCPYLVPLYPPRDVAQSDEEFYRSQGYQYTDGVVEKQDKFLKRMTGIMRLYAAIITAVPKRGQKQNPHGLAEGWKWLAAFLNLEPQPDITATMLHIFFEIAGSTMQATFGKAFQRVMVFVCRVYLPLIQKIDSGGPVTRLEVLLQEYMKVGRFEPPHDVVYVGNLNTQHLEVSKLMLTHGKHVLCEKPLTMNEKQTRELVELAKAKKLFLMEAIWSRCFPSYAKLRNLISSGAVGDILHVTATFGRAFKDVERISSKELGGGTILDLGIYTLQFAQFVYESAEPTAVAARGHLNENGVDDSSNAILTYAGGQSAVVATHSRVELPNEGCVFGTKGIIRVPRFWCPETIITPTETFHFELPNTNNVQFKNPYSVGMSYEVQEVGKCIKAGLLESPRITHAESIQLARLLDQVRKGVGVVFPQDL